MKKLLPVFLVAGVLVLGGGVYLGTRQLSGNYLKDEQKNEEGRSHGSCDEGHEAGKSYTVTIKDNKVSPERTVAPRCSTLAIVNEDDRVRKMAFGVHDHHQTYNGVTEKILTKGQKLSVVLSETGEYTFHDHNQDDVLGHVVIE